MPTALVIGATGFTGREVVRTLCDRGVTTVAHVRSDSPRLDEWRGRFEDLGATTDATAWELGAMTETVRSLAPDLVFACLGTTRARGKAAERATGVRDTYETVDYGLTAMVIDACLAAGVAPRFVYLSAMGTREGAFDAYTQARWKLEEKLRRSGLPFTIARPGIISGPGRDDSRPMEHVAAALLGGVASLVGALGGKGFRAKYQPISGAELGRALVSLGLDPAWEGRVAAGQDLLVRGEPLTTS